MRNIALLILITAILFLMVWSVRAQLPARAVEAFTNMSRSRNAGRVTQGTIAPMCPPGFRFFTDRDGRSMCCRGRVDNTEGRCYPIKDASRVSGECTLGPEYNNEFGKRVQFCGSMMQQLLSELAAKDCPPDMPYRATQDGISGFCCGAPPSAAMPHTCPDRSKKCQVIKEDKNPFEISNSCRLEQIVAQAVCPAEMHLSVIRGTNGQLEGLNIPFCIGTTTPISQTAPMCLPRNAIEELRSHGILRNRDARTWIGNCEVYNKVNIAKTTTMDGIDKRGFE